MKIRKDYETKVVFSSPLEIKGKRFNEAILVTSEPCVDIKQAIWHMTFIKMRKKRKHWYSLCESVEIPVFGASL